MPGIRRSFSSSVNFLKQDDLTIYNTKVALGNIQFCSNFPTLTF